MNLPTLLQWYGLQHRPRPDPSSSSPHSSSPPPHMGSRLSLSSSPRSGHRNSLNVAETSGGDGCDRPRDRDAAALTHRPPAHVSPLPPCSTALSRASSSATESLRMSLLAAADDLALFASEDASPPPPSPLESALARRRSFLMTPFFWHERNIGDAGQGSGPEGREEEEEEGPSLQSPAARVAVHTSEAIATSPSVTNRQIFIASHLRCFGTVTLLLCSITRLV